MRTEIIKLNFVSEDFKKSERYFCSVFPLVCKSFAVKFCTPISLYTDFPGGSDGKASVYNVGDLGLSPGLGRSPGEGNGNPLQYYCLENPMDRGGWWARVHGLTKSSRYDLHK